MGDTKIKEEIEEIFIHEVGLQIKQKDHANSEEINELGILDPVVSEDILTELEQITMNKVKSQMQRDQNLEKIRSYRTPGSREVPMEMQQLVPIPSAPRQVTKEDKHQYKCRHCEKTFTETTHLNRHITMHEIKSKPRSTCEECGKQFTEPKGLQRHIRVIHRGEKRFQCDQCGKKYATSAEFTVHMQAHNGEKPFGCSYCDKRFVRSKTLINHLLIHTGEKKYECKYCEKKFRLSTHLDQHVRLHTGQTYVCHICNRSFRQKPGITKHMHIHKKFTLVKD